MCHYCGCREIPLIKDFIREHEAATDLTGEIARLLEAGDPAAAGALLAPLAAELASHWRGEEDGLFRVMRADPEFAAYIDALEAEHRGLAELLAATDLASPADRSVLLAAFDELHAHIAKEEDGLFPASLIALTAADWNTSMAAWQAAHPDRRPAPPG
ncbi:hemerythrin domain-containing protein [Kitasatospora cineracea]|uniref:hemerythrin domain-containing protein n=1 Tax=Kitasatospora TaxID=2063 RepID=UPI0004C35CFB|nr:MULTISPECIES: hemerythrin domain-containing protein [unclassified Kitasatospora]WAL70639.1 hemerythrin domain-containing protein [Kitasatospora sp. YST-16]WNW36680.1 hemerythrin domain-containing protein [Streptomyces sp. Li-HN-5-13]